MGLALGTANRLSYAKEFTWKETVVGANKYVTARKLLGAGVSMNRTTIQTAEVNARRAITALRLGTRKSAVTVPTELSYGGVTADAAPIAGQTVTVGAPAATTSFTAGTAVTGIVIGDLIAVSGYTGAQEPNNGVYRVVNVASLVLTLQTPGFATMVAGAAQGTAVVLQRLLTWDAVATFDDFMESWMCSKWLPANVGTNTLTAATSIGGIVPGDVISVSGYTTTQLANNGMYVVLSVAGLVLTVAAINYATMVSGAGAGTAVVIRRVLTTDPVIAAQTVTVGTGAAPAAQTVTVGTPAAAGTTLTAGTSVYNIAVGDWIKVTGYTGAQIANNGFYRVTVVAGLVLTVASPNYATMVAGAAQGTAVVLTKMAYVQPGVISMPLVFEERQGDVDGLAVLAKYEVGSIANAFAIDITPDQIMTANFDFVGGGFGSAATAAAAATVAGLALPCATPANPTTSSPMTANDSLLYLLLDNLPVAVITKLSFNGDNGLEDMFPVGAINAYAIGKGDSKVTGSMDLYMTDEGFWTKYNAETAIAISARIMDPDTTAPGKGYAIDAPLIRITGMTENKEKTKVVQSVPFTVLENLTASTKGAATANIRVSRLV